MEDPRVVHIDNLPPAIFDLKDVLQDMRDELSNIHEESMSGRDAVETLASEVRVLRKVLEEVRQALTPLHYLSVISDTLTSLHGR
jgi:hypothetical protein